LSAVSVTRGQPDPVFGRLGRKLDPRIHRPSQTDGLPGKARQWRAWKSIR
jgi:hypothetical protein